MSKPKVSILLPTHNRPTVIPRALDSIYNQEFQDWELIVVENGSTKKIHGKYMDGVVARLPKGFRITWLTMAQKSLPEALNLGLKKAQGEHFAFMSDDDEWKPPFLGTLSEHLDNHFCGLCFARRAEVEAGHPVIKLPTPEKFDRNWLLSSNWARLPMGMVRREALESTGGFGEDWGPATPWIFWCSVARSWPICDLQKTLVVHHWHEDNYCPIKLPLRYFMLQRRMLARGEFGPWLQQPRLE